MVKKLLWLLMGFYTSLQAQTIDHWETAIYADDNWRYTTATAQISSNWKNISYNTSSWQQGQGGIGYGDNDDNSLVTQGTICFYMRKNFNIVDTSVIEKALLDIDYDDAFVAYINGVEIARNNVGNPANYNATAFGEHEAVMYNGGLPERYEIDKNTINTVFRNGNNVLAISIHNTSSASSDLSAIPFLSFGISDNSNQYGPTPPWFQPPFEFTSSTLPIVVLNTNGQSIVDDPRIMIDMGIIDNGPGQLNYVTDTFNNYNGKITIEFRGSSTQGFPKKQYGFSTVDDLGNERNVSLLGMPEENDWILNAPYTDKTMMREYIIYNLARKMGQYATRTKYCEVILNGQYQGVYILFEKIKWDGDRVDIPRIEPDDIAGDSLTGGYIFKVDKTTGSGGGIGWSSTVTDFQGTPKGIFFQYHYPQADMITVEQEQYIQNSVNEFETVLNSNYFNSADSGYHQYIDVASFIDFFLLNEITKNVDGYRLSTYLHKQADSRGGKIYAGPVWDFNITLGNADYCAGDSYTGWALDFPCDQSVIPFWWHRLQQDSNYVKLLNCRYNQLRNTLWNTDTLMDNIDALAAFLNVPQQRNYTVWSILGTYVWPNFFVGQTYQEEVDYFKQWLTNRLDWMDANMFSIGGNPSCESLRAGSVVVSEINYNSANSIEAGDWIELKNISGAALNVSNWKFSDANGVNSFTIPANTVIAPSEYLVLAQDITLFQQQHPAVTNVVGPFTFGLGNSGDQINIQDAVSNSVLSFSYADSLDWVSCADGLGYTLELKDDGLNPAQGSSWQCGCIGGSPGTGLQPCNYPIVFSEINYNSDPAKEAGDWVEIHNTTAQAIDISNYAFADENDTLLFIIPANTTLPANGHLVLYRDVNLFDSRHPQVNNKTGAFQFGLGGGGDVCKLYDATGKLQITVSYDDVAPWPLTADGGGYTLEWLSATGLMNYGNNWFAGCPEGSPGQAYDATCGITSVENIELHNLLDIYPNPFQHQFSINTTRTKNELQQVIVFDIYGKEIPATIQQNSKAITTVSMQYISSGVYFVKVSLANGKSTVIRLLKQ